MRRVIRSQWFYLALILLLYLVLLVPTLARQGISWDEQTDLEIASAYLQPNGWFVGSPLDPSQTRLPHFAVALVYSILQTSDLLTARWVSVWVGVLTLLGVYQYSRQRLTPTTGLVACALLATSPFFLSFARVAFTETDIYLACCLAWLLVCFARLEDRPTVGRAAAVGMLLGLTLSAKFTAVAILPALGFAIFQCKQPGWNLSRKLALGALIGGLACVSFFLLPPEHLTNPAILRSLAERFKQEMGFRPAFMLEAAALHLGSILVKSSPLLGLGLLLGWLIAILRWRRPQFLVPLLVSLCYFGCLVILPLAQTFYVVPLLPWLALFLVDAFLQLWSRWRGAALGLALVALGMLGVDLGLCYPDFNLNGYQWLGARQIVGRASIGYRSIIQTPSDGVEQAMTWLNEHAKPGERVRVYVLEWHIMRAVAPRPAYQIVDGFKQGSVTDPEYVVTEINTMIPQSWWTRELPREVFRAPYAVNWLETRYTKVFGVERAFGIEMAAVWRRN
jgi:4-amino-4-deoxy-L-arabinose transferase-like glycosyltransferase